MAGSPTLHKFVASRFAERTDIWVAQALSQRNYAQGTVFRMKPDVTIVDVDPIWNPAGLPLVRAVAEACPEAHVIVVAPEGFAEGSKISAAAEESGWSTVLRRKADDGANLTQAMVAGLGGASWIDPDMKDGAPGGNESDLPPVKRYVKDSELEEWQTRARQGMSES